MKNVALITGASSGIGREIARIHAERGGDLVLVARREDLLNIVKQEFESKYSVKVKVIVQDLSKSEAPRKIYNQVQKEGIEIEYLVNNAGFGGRGNFHERLWEKEQEMIQVNVVALTFLCRLFLADFVEKNHGRILNVSSIACLTPGPLQAVYFSTKAFVTFLSNALYEELQDTNVTVTVLLPGITDTEFGKVSGMDQTKLFDKAVSARSVAEDGYNAMVAGKLEILSGVTIFQKLMIALIPFIPKKRLLQIVFRLQATE